MMNGNEWLEMVVKEYGSLEKYVTNQKDEGAEPLLFGVAPFNYLLEKNLLQDSDTIRTNLEGMSIDGHYRVNNEGKLEGIEAAGGLYSGKKGTFNPEEILSLNKADNGWTLGFFAKNRIFLSSKL